MMSGVVEPKMQRSWWAKYRLPIALTVVALCLYAFSIAWIVYGPGSVA